MNLHHPEPFGRPRPAPRPFRRDWSPVRARPWALKRDPEPAATQSYAPQRTAAPSRLAQCSNGRNTRTSQRPRTAAGRSAGGRPAVFAAGIGAKPNPIRTVLPPIDPISTGKTAFSLFLIPEARSSASPEMMRRLPFDLLCPRRRLANLCSGHRGQFGTRSRQFPPGLWVGPVNGPVGQFPGGFHGLVCTSDRAARARLSSHRAFLFSPPSGETEGSGRHHLPAASRQPTKSFARGRRIYSPVDRSVSGYPA